MLKWPRVGRTKIPIYSKNSSICPKKCRHFKYFSERYANISRACLKKSDISKACLKTMPTYLVLVWKKSISSAPLWPSPLNRHHLWCWFQAKKSFATPKASRKIIKKAFIAIFKAIELLGEKCPWTIRYGQPQLVMLVRLGMDKNIFENHCAT